MPEQDFKKSENNVFKSDNSSTNKRITTGKSLGELYDNKRSHSKFGEKSNSKFGEKSNSKFGEKSNSKFGEKSNSKFGETSNGKHAKLNNNNKNSFMKTTVVKKPEFQVILNEFPELMETDKKETDKKETDKKETDKKEEEIKFNYKDKILQTKEETNTKYKKNRLNKFVSIEYDVIKLSEYYNPNQSISILENRMEHREELNDILGDISPYWNMQYLDDIEDEYYENNSDNDEEVEEEYTEDW